MQQFKAASMAALLCFSFGFGLSDGAKAPIAATGGCANPADISIAVGSGKKPEKGNKVLDSNIRSKWVSHGDGESLWLELASPTVIDSVAIAFRKGHKRVHKFSVFLVTSENQAELVYEGKSSGNTRDFQVFSFGDKAQVAVAVTIVGHGNTKNLWNGYSEVQLCSHVDGEEENNPTVGFTPGNGAVAVELPFADGRKGFNIVNMCSFPIRVGSTGSFATCSDGTSTNPASGECFWALPEGARDLAPGQAEQYVLPELGLREGSLTWVGNIWASTGCTSEMSDDYSHVPHTETCITNYCPDGGTCPDYLGPAGVCTKAEFALQEGGLDFYDVSIIDGANIPVQISPINPVINTNDHYCGSPGSPTTFGDLDACSWKFSPDALEGFSGADLSPFTRVVWPKDPDNPTSCITDAQCEAASEGSCGIFEERSNGGASKTDAIVPKVCGTPVGWLGAQTACGSSKKSGETFPDDYPYDCHRAARHGTFEQLYRCSGSVYGSQACYLTGAEDSCCGCPPWDEKNGGCVSNNPDWRQTAYPWANMFKSACPTAYSFPRDDRTSMFVCSNQDVEADGSSAGQNTQSYTIKYCPEDSEASFYGYA